jgi:pilus assembly protein Flp/PilA
MFSIFSRSAKRFSKDEAGSNAIEYGLIVALISIAVVTGATSAGTSLGTMFASVSTKLATAAT